MQTHRRGTSPKPSPRLATDESVIGDLTWAEWFATVANICSLVALNFPRCPALRPERGWGMSIQVTIPVAVILLVVVLLLIDRRFPPRKPNA